MSDKNRIVELEREVAELKCEVKAQRDEQVRKVQEIKELERLLRDRVNDISKCSDEISVLNRVILFLGRSLPVLVIQGYQIH